MDISVKALEEAVSIRRQIDSLERRLSSILGGAPARRTTPSATARARWARLKGVTKPAPARKKGALTPAGRRKLSELMKARWAARRKGVGIRTGPTAKKGALTPTGRRKLSESMKARWAARRKAAGDRSAGAGPGPGRRLLRHL
jgi:hypothetical protein